MLRKLLGVALLAFLVFFAVTNPAGAAAVAHHLGAGLSAAARGLSSFLGRVAT